ncbi:uncharacterized protein LOC143904836 [Temnothorax americanus]|uniref:uncharacterized protein LOC143904836 n=1 Tax=Temnothorax americanus TaxID=1964332 RepID=UPI004067C0A6
MSDDSSISGDASIDPPIAVSSASDEDEWRPRWRPDDADASETNSLSEFWISETNLLRERYLRCVVGTRNPAEVLTTSAAPYDLVHPNSDRLPDHLRRPVAAKNTPPFCSACEHNRQMRRELDNLRRSRAMERRRMERRLQLLRRRRQERLQLYRDELQRRQRDEKRRRCDS